mgnify:CR=1 FL=1
MAFLGEYYPKLSFVTQLILQAQTTLCIHPLQVWLCLGVSRSPTCTKFTKSLSFTQKPFTKAFGQWFSQGLGLD